MTIEEIGRNVAERLLQGAMSHEEFTNYYNFLGLQGYKLCHEYHFFEENCSYRDFVTYFVQHYNKLIPTFTLNSFVSPSIIPNNWYEFRRGDMDLSTRRNAVKTGLEKYVQWERQTKRFLEDMYLQAINSSYVSIALKIEEYIESVNDEIKKAEKEHLLIKSTDYDLPTIVSRQQELKKKYKNKRKESNHNDQPQRD